MLNNNRKDLSTSDNCRDNILGLFVFKTISSNQSDPELWFDAV